VSDSRAPKRGDYERIALDGAKATLTAQTAAHVAVLEAADDVADAGTALSAALARRDSAAQAHAGKVAAFAALVGNAEAAHRLDLTPGQLRALTRTAHTTAPSPNATAAVAAAAAREQPAA